MSTSPIGVVQVTFRGAPFPLRLTTSAIMRYELADKQGRGLNQILAEDFEAPAHGPSMVSVGRLIQCMMWDRMPEASIEDAAELIDGLLGNHEAIIYEAVQKAFPDPAQAAPGE